ncbi:heme NO-binding domain-containing protein [Prosthecobacter fluviatilis]|uniref:Heme NO-binding domain-containing protein n=1 Tax=Prosthecobacter fluviatilis TaxID=445931 RepID=A0ABW0KW64_9BACT
MVNKAVQDLIIASHGEEVWQQIKLRAEVDDEIFISTQAYPDEVTYRLMGAASEVLGLPAQRVLHEFGRWWVLKTAHHGYGLLLRAGGRNLGEFLQNLPNFHTRIMMIFPALQPPDFQCTDVAPGHVRLHYRSHRQGLSAFVMGLLHGLAEMFAVTAHITQEHSRDSGADHDVFRITWKEPQPTES